MSQSGRTPEFSRIFEIGELAGEIAERRIVPDEKEREGLRERFGVQALDAVHADLKISPRRGGGLKVAGVVSAKVTQGCVVTLEPVEEEIEETICVIYVPEGSSEPESAGNADPDVLEEYDAFDGETVDLGELAAQQIAAAINPYPRKEGAVFGNEPG